MLDWVTHARGQDQAAALDYVPLPANVQQLARQTILQITVNGQPLNMTG